MRLFLRPSKKPAAANFDIKGIFELYTYHAKNIIDMHEARYSLEEISRAKVELQIMKQLDKAKFPIDYKLAWYNEILKGSSFKAFWLGVRRRLKLPHQAIIPYIPNEELLQYDVPSEHEEDSTEFFPPLNINSSGVNTPLASPVLNTFTAAKQDDTDSSSNDSPDEAAKAYAAKLSGPSTWDNPELPTPEAPVYQPIYTPYRSATPEALDDPCDLDREEGDDGEWTSDGRKAMEKSTAKAKAGKAKAAPKPRAPAKPKGVTKSRAPNSPKSKAAAKPRARPKPKTPAKAKSQIPAQPTPPKTISPPELTTGKHSLIATLKLPTQGVKRSRCDMLAGETSEAAEETLAEVAAKRLKQGLPINLNMRAAMIEAGTCD
ncbi:hypothetical protein N7G274_007729 [Stereocaulon virgatum]|uniref:Uncharacterized protein n=1 Tax=Stereocaulon virgatum TaxID=373712 RepID=A0ABR4A0K0_9LECA